MDLEFFVVDLAKDPVVDLAKDPVVDLAKDPVFFGALASSTTSKLGSFSKLHYSTTDSMSWTCIVAETFLL
jgi:hypothetical protein